MYFQDITGKTDSTIRLADLNLGGLGLIWGFDFCSFAGLNFGPTEEERVDHCEGWSDSPEDLRGI